jgi:hypothetical protein
VFKAAPLTTTQATVTPYVEEAMQHNGGASGNSTFENLIGQEETGESIFRQTVAQFEALNQNYIHLESKMISLEQKNLEQTQANQNLWQELQKSREREHNLEKLLLVFFSCIL